MDTPKIAHKFVVLSSLFINNFSQAFLLMPSLAGLLYPKGLLKTRLKVHTRRIRKSASAPTHRKFTRPINHPPWTLACVQFVRWIDRYESHPSPWRRTTPSPTTKCCLSKCAFYFAIKHHATHSTRLDALGKRVVGRSIRFPHITEEFHHTDRPLCQKNEKVVKMQTYTSAECAKMH